MAGAVSGPGPRLEALFRHVIANGAEGHHAANLGGGLSSRAREAVTRYDERVLALLVEIVSTGSEGSVFRAPTHPPLTARLLQGILAAATAAAADEPSERERVVTGAVDAANAVLARTSL